MRLMKSSKQFIEAMVLTVVVGAILLLSVWQLASDPPVPEAETLLQQIDFLESELSALKTRHKQSVKPACCARPTACCRRAKASGRRK